ncbi:hypothetical protein M0804_007782 [Polistes exclamans]|nr:hypothetical protein M0804_007782 [Polistes exclamans]
MVYGSSQVGEFKSAFKTGLARCPAPLGAATAGKRYRRAPTGVYRSNILGKLWMDFPPQACPGFLQESKMFSSSFVLGVYSLIIGFCASIFVSLLYDQDEIRNSDQLFTVNPASLPASLSQSFDDHAYDLHGLLLFLLLILRQQCTRHR